MQPEEDSNTNYAFNRSTRFDTFTVTANGTDINQIMADMSGVVTTTESSGV